MEKGKIGLVGLAVMGENLVLNIASKGFPVAVFNRTGAKTKAFAEGKAKGKKIFPTYSMKELCDKLEKPRKVILMVKAGQPVDDMIAQIKPHLESGDLLIDGGNSFFKDTERRNKKLEKTGILYIGTGVSGGEEGALHGPCIMPGGQKEAYELVENILTKIAAQVEEGPCCSYIGPGAAGHFVKMVHNGIEYGDMELIVETYSIMKNLLGLDSKELHKIFSLWNSKELNSYLIEITANIFNYIDKETNKALVELILDTAKQKGTGKWTSQAAFDLGVATPTITSAVNARIISGYKEERVAASKILSASTAKFKGNKDNFIASLEKALYASKIISYSQGMALLKTASQEYNFNLNFQEIAQIWKGGCIIRAKLLDEIRKAFKNNPALPNLMVDPTFAKILNESEKDLREVVIQAKACGIPVPAFSASLDYYDSYREARLPANLLQAQRDYFGAHTYQRVDKEGSFHTEWLGEPGSY